MVSNIEKLNETEYINKETGEILSYQEKEYKHDNSFISKRFLSDVRSIDDMDQWMKENIDKRRIRSSNTNDLKRFFEVCLSDKALNTALNTEETLSVPQYKMLDVLIGLITYKNIIMITREDLCKNLKCSSSNLSKKLNLVKPYIEVYTQEDGIRKGEIKILVNPIFQYVCEMQYYSKSRDRAIKDWYSKRISA